MYIQTPGVHSVLHISINASEQLKFDCGDCAQDRAFWGGKTKSGHAATS